MKSFKVNIVDKPNSKNKKHKELVDYLQEISDSVNEIISKLHQDSPTMFELKVITSTALINFTLNDYHKIILWVTNNSLKILAIDKWNREHRYFVLIDALRYVALNNVSSV